MLVDEERSFKQHIYDKINAAYRVLGVIRRNSAPLDKKTFLILYKSLVRSLLEYSNSVWARYKVSLIFEIEKVQKRATKLISICRNMSYVDWLKFLQLPCLQMRRIRGDMIEVFKILHGLYDGNVPHLPRHSYTWASI